jgi:hypothetical protein
MAPADQKCNPPEIKPSLKPVAKNRTAARLFRISLRDRPPIWLERWKFALAHSFRSRLSKRAETGHLARIASLLNDGSVEIVNKHAH